MYLTFDNRRTSQRDPVYVRHGQSRAAIFISSYPELRQLSTGRSPNIYGSKPYVKHTDGGAPLT
jgi:hypothetical protein